MQITLSPRFLQRVKYQAPIEEGRLRPRYYKTRITGQC